MRIGGGSGAGGEQDGGDSNATRHSPRGLLGTTPPQDLELEAM